MKKFLYYSVGIMLIVLTIAFYYNSSHTSFIKHDGEPSVFVKTEGKTILLNKGEGYEPFEIRGVDMGAGKPGHYATEFAITKEEYLRWFKMIQEMGANTIRVYTILSSDFYEAVYEYNNGNPDPLYIIHGLWLNDYVLNSRMHAYEPEFIDTFMRDGRDLIDIIHGNKMLYMNDDDGTTQGIYTKNISTWVLGYILGVEWEDVTVAFTDHIIEENSSYIGEYMSTGEGSTPFEAMLAQSGDTLLKYETERYGTQRLVAFSNRPTTDPFDYLNLTTENFVKIANVDVEHILLSDKVKSGTFASYHVYPYYPDYLSYEPDVSSYIDETGTLNTYKAYLKKINDHHTMPVIISEFGVPSSRGMVQKDQNTGRNQGFMSEKEQGEALIACYNDIMAAGCAGSIVFTWQDEWFKRTWNTMNYTDITKAPYWSDYQTNEQYFGLLSFDPGTEKSVSYVDGDFSEWGSSDIISEKNGLTISSKQDEKFIYFYVSGDNVNETTPLYIPLDITPKTGSFYSENPKVQFDRAADFLMLINGKENSRVLVQERYEVIRAVFSREIAGEDPYEFYPEADSPVFKVINMILQMSATQVIAGSTDSMLSEVYETGKLTYGNANPESPDFNSLADYCFGEKGVEIKLPWLLLNFSNPAEGYIHDDYYPNYGVEDFQIEEIYIGASTTIENTEPISLRPIKLLRWGRNVTWHERPKASYYAMQSIWGEE